MKRKILVLILTFTTMILPLISFAQQLATVKGRITTSDGEPAAYVSVALKDKGNGTITNNNGEYSLLRVRPGSYILKVSAVGLMSQEKPVIVTGNETVIADFVLEESAERLKEVIVAGQKNKYKATNPSPSLRLDAPLLEVPQNIQIVMSSALADQQVISMSDGLIRNVSGAARVEHWGDLYANIAMRGSQIQAFRNGMNVVNSYWGPLTEDMSFVDHIEFVKGPAGFMLANGDPSGLYNVVTKKPSGLNKGEATFTVGSYDLYRATLDLDGSLITNKKLLYRLNIAGQNKNSHRKYEFNNRYSVAPVLSYQINEDTKLTAEYTLQHANMSNVGSFYVFSTSGFATLPVDFTALSPGIPPTKINDHSIFLNLEHRINNNWKLTSQAGYFDYNQVGSSMWPGDVFNNGTMIREVSIWDAKSRMTLGQVFLNGNLKTGVVEHQILTGLDVGTKDYLADWNQTQALDKAGEEFDMYQPSYGVPNNGYPSFDRTLNLEARAISGGGLMDQRYTGIYLQDQLGFLNNRLRLTLAGRYTFVSQSVWGLPAETAKHFTPRVGLSVSASKSTSVYALYDQAFIPQNGVLVGGGSAQPITGNNMEVGVKRDWFGGKWNTVFAIYRIIKINESRPAVDNSGLGIEIGQKRFQGIEFDLTGELARGLNATANYAYTDAEVTKVNQGVSELVAFEGQRIPGSNKHTINTWINYKISEGVLRNTGLSAGLTYLMDRATGNYSSESPDQNLPDYFRLDGGLFWENQNLKLTLNGFNLLNEYLYSGAYYTGYFSNAAYSWQTEAPRNFRLSVAYKF